MKDALKKKLCQRKALIPLIAAVLYMACRVEGFPRTLKEISVLSGVDSRAVGKIYSTISRGLDINVGRVLPYQLVMRLCSQMKFPARYVDVCRMICEAIAERDILEGSKPNVAAAAVILLVSHAVKVTIDVCALCTSAVCEKHSVYVAFQKIIPHAISLLKPHNIADIPDFEGVADAVLSKMLQPSVEDLRTTTSENPVPLNRLTGSITSQIDEATTAEDDVKPDHSIKSLDSENL
jgi:hypothetical protein